MNHSDQKIIFELGHQPTLSLAEIISVFGDKSHTFLTSTLVKYSLPAAQVVEKFPLLGGSIRSGVKIYEGSFDACLLALDDYIFAHKTEGKTRVGIYIDGLKKMKREMLEIFGQLKDFSKREGVSLRVVNRQGRNIDGGTSRKEKLLKEGNFEICFYKVDNNWLMTHSLGIQDVESFIDRDTKKPVRDMQVGMLPPKLARTMINLARDEKGEFSETLWDAFCGTGTVLLEAHSMGIHAVGSDLSDKMVAATKKNLAAFSFESFVVEHNARATITGGLKEEVHAKGVLVSEGFLGRIFSRPITKEQFFQQKDELLPLYEDLFEQISRSGIKRGVLAIPFWKGEDIDYFFSKKVLETMTKMGYILSAQFRYRRPSQVVGREILVFTS